MDDKTVRLTPKELAAVMSRLLDDPDSMGVVRSGQWSRFMVGVAAMAAPFLGGRVALAPDRISVDVQFNDAQALNDSAWVAEQPVLAKAS